MVRSLHRLFKLTHNKKISELPEPYLQYLEKSRAPRERVIDSPPDCKYLDYDQDHGTGYVYRKPDHPMHVVFPPDSEKGLWGGLGMVEGFEKPRRMKPRYVKIWAPQIEKHTFYSDILDVHINVTVTERTLKLIDENQGFDHYILNTRTQDLVSELGRRLQRKMLLQLAQETREEIKEKYKNHIRPYEEVRWHGLKEHEALTLAKRSKIESSILPPLKVTFARELIEQLKQIKNNELEGLSLGFLGFLVFLPSYLLIQMRIGFPFCRLFSNILDNSVRKAS